MHQLYDALAKPIGSTVLSDIASARTSNTYASFALQHTDGAIQLCSEDGTKIAILDVKTMSSLQCLDKLTDIKSEAVVDLRNTAKRKPRSRKPINVTVNIFGPREAADQVSLALSRVNAFLQHPQVLDSHVNYHNPDMLVFPGDDLIMRDYVGVATASWKRDHLIKDIEDILGSLDQNFSDYDKETFLDEGLTSKLTKFVDPE